MSGQHFAPEKAENTKRVTLELEKLAKELNTNSTRLALSWALKNQDVTTAIVGSRKPEQLEDCVKAVELIDKITPEIELRIEGILQNKPVFPFDFRWNKLGKSRREIN